MELIPPETSLQKWSEVFYLRCLRAFGRFRAICPWTVGKRRKSIKMPTGEESVEANQQKPAICPQAPVWMNHICLHLEVRVLRTNSGYCTVPDGKADGMAGSAALVLKDHHLVLLIGTGCGAEPSQSELRTGKVRNPLQNRPNRFIIS